MVQPLLSFCRMPKHLGAYDPAYESSPWLTDGAYVSKSTLYYTITERKKQVLYRPHKSFFCVFPGFAPKNAIFRAWKYNAFPWNGTPHPQIPYPTVAHTHLMNFYTRYCKTSITAGQKTNFFILIYLIYFLEKAVFYIDFFTWMCYNQNRNNLQTERRKANEQQRHP